MKQSKYIELNKSIHQALIKELSYLEENIFQRFIPLESENFIYPKYRSRFYIIIEISIFEGRTKETKKVFDCALFKNISHLLGIKSNDIEIIIFETFKENRGIRAKITDELHLGYEVNI